MWCDDRADSVSNLPYSQRVQTGKVSEGSIGDEADLVVANRELLKLSQAHEAALLQAHQLIGAEVTKIYRATNQTLYTYQYNMALDILHGLGKI